MCIRAVGHTRWRVKTREGIISVKSVPAGGL